MLSSRGKRQTARDDDPLVPMRRIPVPSAGRGRDDEGRLDLAALIGVIFRRWLTIGLVVAVFVGAAFAYLSTTPTTWRATSRVLLDPRDKQVVGSELERPLQGVDAVWIDTQADLVKSAEALRAVVVSQNLMTDDEFGGATVEDSMREFGEAVLVARPELTYVLEVSVTTRDPEKSARLSRALADAFVSSLVDAKAAAVRQANDLLSGQVDDLREKARQADEALQAYKRENGILVANGRLVDEETLQILNAEHNAAKLATSAARERWDRLAAAVRAGTDDLDSAMEAANSAVIGRLKIDYATAVRNAADLGQQLGPSHPRMQAAEAQVVRIRSLIRDEVRSIAATAEADFDLALARERNAATALERATSAVNASSAAGVRLRELENEATARREIYRAFVSRIEETGQQQKLQVSDARVIVPAPFPQYPHSPRRSLVLALALIAGLGTGVSAAIYRGRADLIRYDRDLDERPDWERDAVAHYRGEGPDGSAPVWDPRPDGVVADRTEAPDVVAPDPGERSDEPIAEVVPAAPRPGAAPARVAPEPPPPVVAARSARSRLDALLDDLSARSAVAADEGPDAAPIASGVTAAPVEPAPARRPPAVEEVAATMPAAADPSGGRIVPVVLDLTVDTGNADADGRSALGSAFETASGARRTDVLRRLAAVLLAPSAAAGRGEVILVQALCHAEAGAAAAVAIAAGLSFAGESTLVLDASADRVLAAGFLAPGAPGVADVLARRVSGDGLASAEDPVGTVVALTGVNGSSRSVTDEAFVDFTLSLAERFDRTVIHSAEDVSSELFAALAEVSDRILLVVDAADGDDAGPIVADLAAAAPQVSGLVSVRDLGGRGRAAA